MSTFRRFTQALGVVALALVGTLLILEATDVITGEWRGHLADGFDDAANPTWPLWASALTGFSGALVGITMVAAQFVPEKRGFRTMHHVQSDPDGETRLAGRAAIAAVRYEIARIEGVVEVTPTIRKKRMAVDVQVDDRANLIEIEHEARRILGHEFWIELGLADFALDLLVTHHPKPPRVR